jgi:diacylglycerol O-acyltransferase
MAYTYWERLSAVDAAFLAVEDANAHMHIGSISLFEAALLKTSDGGLDFERLLEFATAQLHKVPRFRQKLAYAPGFGQPGWIDDDSFNPLYHMRHTALPAPGDIRQLKRLAGRVMSQQLDRGKPLWELWFVEGIEGDRFAMISKIHHCLADGISGRDAMQLMVGRNPSYTPGPPPRWVPRPAPTDRRIDWTEMSLAEVRDLGVRAGGKINDVALAVVTGAVRRFLKQRGVRLEELAFKAALPVSIRTEQQEGTLGNRVAAMLATLPLEESDPWQRLLRIVDTTHELKASGQVGGAQLAERLAELVPYRIAAAFERVATRRQPANLVVTNVPGPQETVYMLGAAMSASYPIVPLAASQALGVALYSYAGNLCWGLNADWDALPDLHDIEETVLSEFDALRQAAPRLSEAHG